MSEAIEHFQRLIEELVAQVEAWVAPREEWVTKRYPKRIRDESRQIFEVPALFLQKGPSRLLLDPMSYEEPGPGALVDLYLMPTYDDMANLYYVDGQWCIDYNPGVSMSRPSLTGELTSVPLTETALNKVLNEIADHAVPSV
jgi:hypothetical protein